MYLSNTSIKRPVFTTMVILALVVLGVASYNLMSVDLMPDVDFPFVVVTIVYPGAGPEAVANDVTKKVEDAVNPINGVKHVTSNSMEGFSQVMIEFSLETKSLDAGQEVREKVATIRADLPRDIEAPVIQRFDPASQPILSLVMASPRSSKELTSIAKNILKKRLESIEGVGAVQIIGGSEREFQVFLDLDALNARQLTFNEVSNAIAASNFELPAGRLDQGPTEMLVRTMGRFQTVNDIKNVVVKNTEGKVIRLSDIASVADTIKEQRSISRYNGKEAVTLQITRQSGSNTVKVAESIKARLQKIQAELPADVKVEIATDGSVFIRESVDDVQVTILYGGLLAIVCIFLFLTNIPSTVISAIAIPTSIVATFTVMKALGFTLNLITLMGLSLAVGLLIDDAIVVIENIYRHLAQGESSEDAARNGTSEIGLAVMATTFSIVVVFVPIAFMSGIVGRFFYQFGLTVAFAVMVSLFVAFTLTPMLSARWLHKEEMIEKGSKNPIKIILYYWNHAFARLSDFYKITLRWVLHHRAITLTAAIIGFLVSMYLAKYLGSTFTPDQDRSELYVSFETRPGSSIDRTSQLAQELERKIASHKDVVYAQLLTVGGENIPVNQGNIYVKMVEKNKRDISVFKFVTILRKELADIPGMTLNISLEQGHGGEMAVEYSVCGPDYDKLIVLADKVEKTIKNAPGAVDVENSEKQARPELRIAIDRDVADDAGLNLAAIGTTVRSMVDGADVSRFKEGEEEYYINVRLAPKFRTDIDNLNNIFIPSFKKVAGNDYSVPLRQVAQIYEASAPQQINRYDRQREIKIGSNVGEGFSMGDITKHLESKRAELNIPTGYSVQTSGMTQIQEESFTSIFTALALAIIFIYILLASQFESFVDPFSMGMSLLMAPVGAILALLLFGSPLSIMSLIGMVLLMGLVTKNAILLVDFIKQARRRGVEREEAILQAGPIRLRPIMMTSLAMIFAMTPLAFAIGPGAEMRAPMAQAVIGGLVSSTMLTLIVVPIVYTLLDDLVVALSGKGKSKK